MEVHHSLVELIEILLYKHPKLVFIPLLCLLHSLQNRFIVTHPLLTAFSQTLKYFIIKCYLWIMLYVKHHLQMSQCTENIFNYQEAFDFVEKDIKIFVYVVHIRVSLVCIFIGPDVKEKMTCPDVNLRRTWSICHIRLKIDKTCVDLIS